MRMKKYSFLIIALLLTFAPPLGLKAMAQDGSVKVIVSDDFGPVAERFCPCKRDNQRWFY